MLQNKWGRCSWAYELENDKIHPDDLEAFKQLYCPFWVYQCIGFEGEYIKIKCMDYIYRVKSECFKVVSEPKFRVGEDVYIKEDVIARIFANQWHLDRKEHYYFVTVNGKKKTRMYFESEIRKC